MWEAELLALGLTSRQSRVYLHLAQLEEAPASLVAKRLNFPRLTAYSILERLRSMGLVSAYENRRTRLYKVNSPDALLSHCDQEILSLQVKRTHLKRFLPRLKSHFSHFTLETPGEESMHFLTDRLLFLNRCCKGLDQAVEWRVIHDGRLWGLLTSLLSRTSVVPACLIPFSQRSMVPSGISFGGVRVFPNRALRLPLNTLVIGERVFFIFDDSHAFSAVEIHHRAVADQFKGLFDLLWLLREEEH